MQNEGQVKISINGSNCEVTVGSTVASAIINSGAAAFRDSVNGGKRGPLCGMGVCYECRAQVDGVDYSRTCMIICEEGMEVVHD